MTLMIRDFVCRDCGKTFEKLSKGIHGIECPHCGSGHCTFLHAPQAIKATGQGVYSTKMHV
jgi:predicted Zn-ribbon and HTH transcriptional regulator